MSSAAYTSGESHPGAPRVADVIRSRRRFLLSLHENPDGDSVGSTLAMRLALEKLGKVAVVAADAPVPKTYAFLPGSDAVVPWEEMPSVTRSLDGGLEVALLIDCGDLSRVGRGAELAGRLPVVVNVDHHPTNDGFGHVNYVDPGAAAAAEQVYRIIQQLGVPLDRDMATCLLTAVMTDTGSFRYENASANALETAAVMVRAGARPQDIAERVFDAKSVEGLRLLQRGLATLRLSRAGRVAWLHLTAEDFAATGATEGEAEGIVNYARSVNGAEVGVLFREVPGGLVRVAFRSRREVDVGVIAASFGGGGHARAAGCTVAGSLGEVSARVLDAVSRAAGDRLE